MYSSGVVLKRARKNIQSKENVLKIDWTTCSKQVKHFMFNSQRSWGSHT